MSPRRSYLPLCLSALFLTPLAGCGVGSAAKQVLHEVRGAQTEIMLISRFQSDTLTRYKAVSFDPATTTVGAALAAGASAVVRCLTVDDARWLLERVQSWPEKRAKFIKRYAFRNDGKAVKRTVRQIRNIANG